MIVLTGVVNKLSRPRDDHGTALANTRRIQKGFEPNRARQKPPTGTTQSIAKNSRRKPPTRHGTDSAAPTRRSGSAWRGAPTQLPHAPHPAGARVESTHTAATGTGVWHTSTQGGSHSCDSPLVKRLTVQ